jgi:hypothetical protein
MLIGKMWRTVSSGGNSRWTLTLPCVSMTLFLLLASVKASVVRSDSIHISQDAMERVTNIDMVEPSSSGRRSQQRTLFSSPLFRDPLVDWLDKLHVDVPDQSFSTKWVKIEIRDLICTHFVIQNVDSDYQPAAADTAAPPHPHVRLTVWNVAATCQGSYQSTGGVGGKITAQLAGKTNNDTTTEAAAVAALQWTVAVLDDTAAAARREPGAVETVSCDTQLVVKGLHFSGSLSAKLIELFRDQIEHAVNAAVEDQICPVLVQTVDPLLSSYLQTAVQWLQPYLTPPQSLVVVSTVEEERSLDEAVSPSMIQFDKDLPVLTNTLDAVNNFVEDHLHRGFLPIPSKCGGFSDGVNGVLRELQKSTTGARTLPVPHQDVHLVLPKYAEIDLRLHNLTIAGEGLSQWTNLTLLRPHNESFRTVLETASNVSVMAVVTLRVVAVPGGMFHGDNLTESFVVHIDTEGVAAAMDMSADLDKLLFEQVSAGTLVAALNGLVSDDNLSMTPEAACLLEPFQSLKASGLSAWMNLTGFSIFPFHSIDNATMASPTVVTDEELEQDVDALLDNIIQLFLQEYQPMVTDSIVGLSKGPVQDRLNQFLAHVIERRPEANCTKQDDSKNDDPHWVNFTKVEPMNRLNSFLGEAVTLSNINQYLDCTTELISETIRRQLVSLDFLLPTISKSIVPSFLASNSASSLFRLRDFEIKHAGSLRRIELLSPVSDGLHLLSSLLWGSNSTDATLRPQVFASLDLDHAPLNLSATVNVTVYLDSIGWDEGTILRFDSRRFQLMTLSQLLSHGQCALVPVHDFVLYGFEANLGFFETIVNASLTTGGDDTVNKRYFSIDSKDFPDVQGLVSSFFEWAVNTARDVVGAASTATLSRSIDMCDGGSSTGPHDDSSANDHEEMIDSNTILLIVAAIFIFAQPAILLMKRSQDSVEEENSHIRPDDLAEPLLHPRYSDDSTLTDRIPASRPTSEPDSLMFDANVPELGRHLIPILVLVVIAVLVSSNLSVGATVDLVVSLDDGELRLPPLFGFSLFNTAKDMLDARIYPLFFLVVVFSGVWPYVKLFLMLAAWISPKSVLCHERREALLLKLDALSKFSLVDTYVLVGEFACMLNRWHACQPTHTLPPCLTLLCSYAGCFSLSPAAVRRFCFGRICDAPVWVLRVFGRNECIFGHRAPHGVLSPAF